MTISEPFIRRPIGTTLLAVGLFLVGVVAYFQLPVASLPAIEFPAIRVNASRPGADPATMAATVAAPLERRLGEISGVNEITSTSSLGSSAISLQFDLGRKVDDAARDVQAALNAAATDLPGDLPTLPTYRKANSAAFPVLILALTSKNLPITTLFDAADTVIAQKISQVEGVAEVTVNGAAQPAVRVRIDPQRLAAMGLSVDAVRTAIGNNNVGQAIGSFDGPDLTETLATTDRLTTPEDFAAIVVRSRNGTTVKLSDVADVANGVKSRRAAGWYNQDRSVLLIVTKQPDANVIDTVDRVKALLPQIRQWVPEGVDISVFADRTITIRAAVRDIQITLLITCALVMAVVLLFLRRATPTLAAGRRGAALAGRYRGGDVGGRLLARQPVLDGHHHLGRFRGRRCHRHDRERGAQHRSRHSPDARDPARGPADRLHGRVDQPVARGRLRAAAVHGRHRGQFVPRIRPDPHLLGAGLDDRVADPDPDVVRPFHEAARCQAARLVRPRRRRRARGAGRHSTPAACGSRCATLG